MEGKIVMQDKNFCDQYKKNLNLYVPVVIAGYSSKLSNHLIQANMILTMMLLKVH